MFNNRIRHDHIINKYSFNEYIDEIKEEKSILNHPNCFESVNYVDISLNGNVDLVRWQSSGKLFPLDIIAAREKALENVVLHHENNTKRMVFIRKKNFTFTIGSNEEVQYQILEAILNEISKDFLNNFENIPHDLLTSGMIKEYATQIPSLLKKTEKESIKWVSAFCRVCNQDIQIAIKKMLVTEAKNYPVALVYYHQGHGILLYLDANLKVRGVEQVDISG